MNIPNFALRYQVVRSSSGPKAHPTLGAKESEDAASASFMKSRRSCEEALISLRSPVFECHGRSIEMKNLVHLRPPLALFSCRKRFLHRPDQSPPLLSLDMRSHLAPVTFQIASVIFEVAEEHAVLQVNGIVPNVAFKNLVQDLGPNRRVTTLVGFLAAWLELDHQSKALHRSHP